MALVGPDGEQHTHVTRRDARDAMLDKVGGRRAGARSLPAAMRPDRGRWVGPVMGEDGELHPQRTQYEPDGSPKVTELPSVAPSGAPSAAPAHTATEAMIVLAKLIRDYSSSMSPEDKNALVRAMTVVATNLL